jgi:hypothetical protein
VGAAAFNQGVIGFDFSIPAVSNLVEMLTGWNALVNVKPLWVNITVTLLTTKSSSSTRI